ncbi:class A beta-lactamase-related serine hydrolase, partial [Staphylococcus simulans]|uniref:serine hydrolase domain-containing protein n=1 Tax=Staphylococcus simulans TaxID=1286 RepID=UPI000FF33CE8
GKHHAYSNANYWVLAYLVEKVSKVPFKKYMNKNIFGPVNMKHSFVISNSEHSSEQLPKGNVTAYGQAIPWDEMTRMDLGAGGVVTTAEDMGEWLVMQTNNGVSSSNQRVISRKLLNESQSAQPGSDKYGLGWSLNYDNDNLKRIKHSGVDTGYQAQQDIDTD